MNYYFSNFSEFCKSDYLLFMWTGLDEQHPFRIQEDNIDDFFKKLKKIQEPHPSDEEE